jgi:16S rRNA G966 N2-methylase RsmD
MMECIPGLRDEMHPLHVLDAFAGAGGNTIYFMCTVPGGSHIDAVQIAGSDEDKDRVKNLEYNVALCRPAMSRGTGVSVFGQPIREYIAERKLDSSIDLLFADPPWRVGADKSQNSNASDVLNFMKSNLFFDDSFRPRYIIFKMPSTVPIEQFDRLLNSTGKKMYKLEKQVGVLRKGMVRYWAYGFSLVSENSGYTSTISEVKGSCAACGKHIY